MRACVRVCVCVCVCVHVCVHARVRVCIRTEVHGLCNIHYACIFVYTALAKKIADGMKKSLIFDLHAPESDLLPDLTLLECVGLNVLTRLVETKPLCEGVCVRGVCVRGVCEGRNVGEGYVRVCV